jgi:hypothetical protein
MTISLIQKVKLDASGNLGIGVINPQQKLHVAGNARIQGDLIVNGTTHIIDTSLNTTNRLEVTNDGTGPALIINQLGVQPIAEFKDEGNTIMIIQDGGLVGIGTLNPVSQLDISGTLTATNINTKNWFIQNDNYVIRNQLQIHPINRSFKVTDISQSVFDISMNGRYTIEPQNAHIYVEGTKLGYYDATIKDYDTSTSYIGNTTTVFHITLTNPVYTNNAVEITIYPQFLTDDIIRQPGYVYQAFYEHWDVSGNNTTTFTNVGIGTNYATQSLDVSGSAIISNTLYVANVDFSNNLYKNGQLYISSQWTDASNNQDLFFNRGKVGIGSLTPIKELDVSGNINFSGDLYKSGQLYISSQWTDASNNQDLFFSRGNVGINTSNPQATLDISGNLNVNNIYVRNSWFIENDSQILRNQLQLQPISKTFRVTGTSQSVFDISMSGIFTITPKSVNVFVGGIKMIYRDSSNKDYDVAVIHVSGNTLFTITLSTPVYNGEDVDIVLYPEFINELGNKQPGYFLQNVISGWDICGNVISYTDGNVGIGTSIPIRALDVSGGINFTDNLYKNGQLYISSQWTDASNNQDLYFSRGKVGIGSLTPIKELDVSGNINFSGNLFKSGQLYISSQWTDTSNNYDLFFNRGKVGINTNNPSHELDVSGTIIAKRIIATEDWFIQNDSQIIRNQLQVNPIHRFFRVTDISQAVFDISMSGLYTTTPQNVHVYYEGSKLIYKDANNNDYSVTVSLYDVSSTLFTITLNTALNIGEDLDVTVYPQFLSDNTNKQPGYVYQSFSSPWDVSNNQVYYNTGNVGIGTSNPQDKLDVMGNVIPSVTNTYDLGSSDRRWRDLYLSGSSINLDGVLIKKSTDISDSILVDNIQVANSWFVANDNNTIRNQLQITPLHKSYRVTETQSSFDISMNGRYTTTPLNVHIYYEGTKLSYNSPTVKDYDVTVTYIDISNTLFTVDLVTPVYSGNVIDITIYPQYLNDNTVRQPGYIYQEFKDFLWTITNNNISYGLGNLGIGTNTPSTTFNNGALTVTGGVGIGGNLNIGGNMSIVGDLVINGTTTVVNSNTVTVNDPIITLGGNTTNDVKDRGIDFNWYDGVAVKKGFIGLQQASNKFVFLSDASSNNDVYYGTAAPLETSNFMISSDTSSNPGFTWSGNQNTGMYQPTSNNIGFTVNGTERMRLSSNGYLGIGTDNPLVHLDVRGFMTNRFALGDYMGFNAYYGGSPLGWRSVLGGTSNPSFIIRSDNNPVPRTQLFCQPGNATANGSIGIVERMSIKTDGNVGIGINNPQATLDVSGNILISNNNSYQVRRANNTVNNLININNINDVRLYGQGGALHINPDSNISDTRINQGNTQSITMYNGGNVRVQVTGTGVGINKTPSTSLDVSGNMSVSGNVSMSGTLTTNNPGWILWHNAGGNAVYDAANKIWGSTISNGIYFDATNPYNGASSSAWNSSTGVFTFPSAGLYLITINMFINGATAGRTGLIRFTSSISPLFQYIPFDKISLPDNTQKTFTMVKQCNANDNFYVYTETGSITLYLAQGHSTFFINKIG